LTGYDTSVFWLKCCRFL